MTSHFGRAGRRADLARLLHQALVDRGMSPLDGAARRMIDDKIAEIAAVMRISGSVALREVRDADVIALAERTAADWHAAHIAQEAAGAISVVVPAESAARLVMGLAMAVGQLVREVFGELPAAAGEPLDALCELGSALHEALRGEVLAEVTLETLSKAHGALLAAADGVATGRVPVVVDEGARALFARNLEADAELARRLQP